MILKSNYIFHISVTLFAKYDTNKDLTYVKPQYNILSSDGC
jgi:hypothetical protein